MLRRYLINLLLILLLTACHKNPAKNNVITTIELSRLGSWQDFGATISIDSSLVYQYWGDYKGIKQGFFKGRVSRSFWDTLNSKLERVKFKTYIPLEDHVLCQDCTGYDLIIYWNNHKRRFGRINLFDIKPDSILTFMRWVDRSYKNIALKQIKDSIKFEVYTHEPPKPRINSIKFPPPEKSNK